jgi:1-aminocyclopropane-1-carboxylate deaminase/D-cysteine desulfhydrase-like pyridoxal-dependent ACC family enzyme
VKWFRFSINFDFHFGGYAKKNEELISFMNEFYRVHSIPTDFVYTGKLMFAIRKLLESGYFPAGSRILSIHSGGLQGNKSLKKGTLVY